LQETLVRDTLAPLPNESHPILRSSSQEPASLHRIEVVFAPQGLRQQFRQSCWSSGSEKPSSQGVVQPECSWN